MGVDFEEMSRAVASRVVQCGDRWPRLLLCDMHRMTYDFDTVVVARVSCRCVTVGTDTWESVPSQLFSFR